MYNIIVLLSNRCLMFHFDQDLPACKFERYGGLYTIELKPIPSPNVSNTGQVLLATHIIFITFAQGHIMLLYHFDVRVLID